MRILIALTYYRPHVSGLTIYAERLARGLARRGHAVTVLTSRFAPELAEREERDGVRIVRVPVALKVSKGVIMPGFPRAALAAIAEADVVNVHMPQFEAALVTWLARARRRPVVLTYQCDLRLPAGGFNRAVEWSLRPLNRLAAAGADAIVVSSDDYARHSPFLTRTRAPCTRSRRWSICPSPPTPPPTRCARRGDRRARPSASPPASRRRRGSSPCSRRCRRSWPRCPTRASCSAGPTRIPSARRRTGSAWCRCSSATASACCSSTSCQWRPCRASSPPATCWR